MQKKAHRGKQDILEDIKEAKGRQKEFEVQAGREGRKAGVFAGLSIGSLLSGVATSVIAQTAAENQQIEGWSAAGITIAALGISVLGSAIATRGEKTHAEKKQGNLRELDHMRGVERGYWIELQKRR